MKDPLRAIPGVGPSIAADLRAIGVNDPTGLRGKNPERLYARSNALSGVVQDRCLLYVFRCAVYFANTSRHQPELLKWWNWSDAALASTSSRRRSSRPPTAPRRPASSARR
jgi:adenine-specific DNA glycosylase